MPDARILTLVLAGGEGSRLGVLTERRAKPVMPYAGTFRLIDIPLSNAMHSELSDVWIVEQYRPHALNEQLANGRPWDLDRTHRGLRVLPPYEGGSKDGFAKGNADAIFQHLDFIREFEADLILVLSADHIYHLDYREVVRAHHEQSADLTIVTTEVPREEAGRYGVVETDGARVTGFAYKPDDPTTGRVTTEVFLYDADVLLDTLETLADESKDDNDLGDYGDTLVPHVVSHHDTYHFALEGYWRDVGLPESYWEGHMDLLGDEAAVLFDDPAWPILTIDPKRLPARLCPGAELEDALVSPGAVVWGRVERSVLGPGVVVEEGAVVRDAVLLRDVLVEAGARVDRAILDEHVTVGRDARVGAPAEGASADEDERPPLAVVGANASIGAGGCVEPGQEVASTDPVHLGPRRRSSEAHS